MYTNTVSRVDAVNAVLAHDAAVKAACPSLSGAIHPADDGIGYYADCPACEASGYVNSRVCSQCFGGGDVYGETIEELVSLMVSL